MNTSIKCIHCGKDIEISEAIRHEVEEQLKVKISKDLEQKLKAEARLEYEEKQKEVKQLLEEANKRVLESEKRIKENEEKIREETEKAASEKHRLEKLEYEKKFADMQKALEEAQRKGKQGSQQLQGEVLELDLEEQLKTNFPDDEFLPIPKGVEGGDIWQKVIDGNGHEVGSILWETKRAKTWDKKWLPKLRANSARVNASESILVSQVLPEGVKGFHLLDRVWVSDYEYALHTARIIRFILRKIAATKNSISSHTDEDLQKIRDYINSDNFKHKINMHYDVVTTMRDELDSEIRLTQVRWKRREEQIKSLNVNISQLEGEIQNIMDLKQLPGISAEAESDS